MTAWQETVIDVTAADIEQAGTENDPVTVALRRVTGLPWQAYLTTARVLPDRERGLRGHSHLLLPRPARECLAAWNRGETPKPVQFVLSPDDVFDGKEGP
jgi:hypothetical protein